MSAEDPAGQFTDLLIQAAKLYQKRTSRKKLPKFHGLMTAVKKQLKKESSAKVFF